MCKTSLRSTPYLIHPNNRRFKVEDLEYGPNEKPTLLYQRDTKSAIKTVIPKLLYGQKAEETFTSAFNGEIDFEGNPTTNLQDFRKLMNSLFYMKTGAKPGEFIHDWWTTNQQELLNKLKAERRKKRASGSRASAPGCNDFSHGTFNGGNFTFHL